MARVFGEQGLVIACPRIFRQEISALMGRAIENPERVDRLLQQQKKSLEDKGYPCHTKWDDPLWLYRLTDGAPLSQQSPQPRYSPPPQPASSSVARGRARRRMPECYPRGRRASSSPTSLTISRSSVCTE